VLDAGDRVYVGPGVGGAPREAVFDEASGVRLEDFFAGDPGGRSGLVFVGVGLPAEVVVANPHAESGAGYSVLLDFEGGETPAFQRAVVADMPALLPGVADRVGVLPP
jgi:hypothetical protein